MQLIIESIKSRLHNTIDFIQKNNSDSAINTIIDILRDFNDDILETDINRLSKKNEQLTTEILKKEVYLSAIDNKIDDTKSSDESDKIESDYSIELHEKMCIERALEITMGNRKKACAILDISERTLYRKLLKYKIEC